MSLNFRVIPGKRKTVHSTGSRFQARCGLLYQDANATTDDVTCKSCLRLMEKTVYLVKPLDEEDKRFCYDCNHGFVIRAVSESEARNIASSQRGDEDSSLWLDPAVTSCKSLETTGASEIIMVNFNAG